ncbi:hypothetical protein AMTRI_Chr10g232070 [Amborella trichopoda]
MMGNITFIWSCSRSKFRVSWDLPVSLNSIALSRFTSSYHFVTPSTQSEFTEPLSTLPGIVAPVIEVLVQNQGLDALRLNQWSVDLVSEVLRAIPRYFFQSERSLGCQKGFRRRAPLRQRNLYQETEDSKLGLRIRGPAAYRNPKKVEEGVNKALAFFFWLESEGGFQHTEITCREMACTLAKGNSLKILWKFLHEMHRKGAGLVNTVTVTCVIKILGEEGLVNEALGAFYRMKQFHCKPDVVAYNAIICVLCRVCNFKKAKFLMGQMELPGSRCPPDTFTYTIMINFYCKYAMQTGCSKAIRRRLWEANHLFRLMVFKGFKPDVVTYNCLIDGLCKTYRIGRALELLNDMLQKCSPNKITYNSFIRFYSAVNDIDKAIKMLRDMISRDHGVPTSSSYTPIIHALCEGGRVLEARDFLVEMVERGSIPRAYTYKLVRDALLLASEDAFMPSELCMRIEEGIRKRYEYVKKVKPVMVT